jgi:hypothetical protein
MHLHRENNAAVKSKDAELKISASCFYYQYSMDDSKSRRHGCLRLADNPYQRQASDGTGDQTGHYGDK